MKRRVLNGRTEYRVKYGKNIYTFVKAWHHLENGEPYHYIHVHKNNSRFPIKRFAWVIANDGTIELMCPAPNTRRDYSPRMLEKFRREVV